MVEASRQSDPSGGAAPLFEEYRLGRTVMPNRIVMSAMTRSFCPDGVPGSDVADYYRRRAEGGAGLIITEGTWVPHPSSANNPSNPNFFGESALAGWRRVVEDVHKSGGRIMPQLWHVGLFHRMDTGGVQPPKSHHRGPSGLSGGSSQEIVKVGEPMSLAEIDGVIDAFATAAEAALELGFDGVELHGGHGYLIDQFLWHRTNLRTDRYGGGHADRAKFAAEIVAEIRRRTGPDFPILMRYSQWKQHDYEARLAETPEQLEAILRPIVDAGIDLFDCSQRRFWEPGFAGSDLNLAGWTRKLTGKPTMTVGSVGLEAEFIDSMAGGKVGFAELDRLLKMFNESQFELVGVGRAQIADPEWANKVRSGQTGSIVPFNRDALGNLT